MSTKRKLVATEPKWQDVPLFEKTDEPRAAKADWALHDEVHGPGALDKDVFAVWSYVNAYPNCTRATMQRYLEIGRDWDFHRTGKAIQQALGVRAVEFGKGDGLVATDCKHVTRSMRS